MRVIGPRYVRDALGVAELPQPIAPPIVEPRIVSKDDVRHGALPMVSSTHVREVLARGEDTAGLVPAAVAEYIRKHGLYRSQG